jgi:hypothetical protein
VTMAINLVLGMLLAAILIAPVAWARPDQAVRSGVSVVVGDLWHATQSSPVLTTVRSALVHTP